MPGPLVEEGGPFGDGLGADFFLAIVWMLIHGGGAMAQKNGRYARGR